VRPAAAGLVLLAFAVLPFAARAEDGADAPKKDAPVGDAPVTREEYEKLKKEMDEIKAKLGAQPPAQQAAPPAAGAESESALDEFEKDIRSVKSSIEGLAPGSTKLLLAGAGFAGFSSVRGSNTTFDGGFELLPLVKLSDSIFFESNFAFTLDGSSASVDVGFAHLCWIACDYLTVGIGLFPNPANKYHELLDPVWLNRLPDDPLPLQVGLIPDRELGIDVRGAFPIGPLGAFNYAVFVSNGPSLVTDNSGGDVPGTLIFTNYTDVNDNKSVGAHFGWLPLADASLEIGYGVQWARVGAAGTGFKHVEALFQSVDLDYARNSETIQGRVDVRAQWIWQQVGTTTYDPDGSLGFGPLTFANNRNGGYVQASYRPSLSKVKVLEDLELLVRWAALNQPNGAGVVGGGFNEWNWTVGIDYWLAPSIVVKLAYEWDDKDGPVAPGTVRNANAVLFQVALGF
jgi:hypothetical protein